MRAGMARNLLPYYRKGKDRLSPTMRSLLEDGQKITAVDYLTALDWREALATASSNCSTGMMPSLHRPLREKRHRDWNDRKSHFQWPMDAVRCPAVTLPLMKGPKGMPVGVELVGRQGDDARLLRTARWLTDLIEKSA